MFTALKPKSMAICLAALLSVTGAAVAESRSQALDCAETGLSKWQIGDAIDEPHEVNHAFRAYFNARDIEGLMSLYDENSVMIAQPGGAPLQGRNAIRETLDWLIATGGTLDFDRHHCLQTGDIALMRIDFELVGGRDRAGEPLALSGRTSEVVKRNPDGTWIYIFDHVFGAM